MKRNGVIIQVSGPGKGCGKTTLICALLGHFPGSGAFKSGRHGTTGGTGDSRRYARAGAAEFGFYVSGENDAELINHLENSLLPIIFLERNSVLTGFQPDLTIFMDVPVRDRRDDADRLRAGADYIIQGNTPDTDLLTRIRKLAKNRGVR